MENKKKIQQVIVVEGRDDTANLKRFFEVDTYETGGSSIDEDDLERLKRIQKTRGIIVFTDPDYQGERIRKIIMQAVPDASHAFLKRDEAAPKGKGSLGIEHAGFESLKMALSDTFDTKNNLTESQEVLTDSDLMRFGLIMASDSRARREYLCNELRIGYANGKQLKKRLKMFSIKLTEVEKIMGEYESLKLE